MGKESDQNMELDEERFRILIEDAMGEKPSAPAPHNNYSRLPHSLTALAELKGPGKLQRRGWKLRVRPRVRVVFSALSSLAQRVRRGYSRIMLGLAARARKSSLLPSMAHKKKRGAPAIGHTPKPRTIKPDDLEQKYLDYVKRTVAEGELAYYITSFSRTTAVCKISV